MLSRSLRTALCLLPLLAACDSGTPAQADTKAKVAVDARANAGVDAKAVADTKADMKADMKADIAVKAPEVAVVGGVVVLKPVVEVEAALGKPIVLSAADLDLEAIVDLMLTGKIKSAAELELLLNAPVAAGGASHHVDLDVDGTLDYLQVVEVRAAGAVTLELRAIASSKLDASLAVLVANIVTTRAEADGELKVAANYAAEVKGGADFKLEKAFKAEFKGDAVVVADAGAGAFLGWAVDVGRPSWVSTHVSTADITLAADGAVQFGVDAAVRLSAEQLAALRGSLKVELAAVAVPDAKLDVGGKLKVKHDAKADAAVKAGSSVKSGASAGVKVGGGKVGGSVGVSLGGGASLGGSSSGKAGAGIKIGGK